MALAFSANVSALLPVSNRIFFPEYSIKTENPQSFLRSSSLPKASYRMVARPPARAEQKLENPIRRQQIRPKQFVVKRMLNASPGPGFRPKIEVQCRMHMHKRHSVADTV